MGGVDSESFADELVDNFEQLEAARVGGLVELEVQRPYVVGHLARSLVAVPVGEPPALGTALGRLLQVFISLDPPRALGPNGQHLKVRHRVRLAPPRPGMHRARSRRCCSAAAGGALVHRWVERCHPTTAQALRLETRTASEAARPPPGCGPESPLLLSQFLEHRLVRLRLARGLLGQAFSASRSLSRLASAALMPAKARHR